jgi:cobalt-precorrin-6B (C15)-methyltransferase
MRYPNGTPTQPEIIAVALSKLELKTSDVFADIGCGSGSVSIRASGQVQKVYAIDKRDEAISAAQENIIESGATNIELRKGDACELLSGIDIDCAFVGGSANIETILEILIRKTRRFVVSAVRIETAAKALEIIKQKKRFKELLQVHIARGQELAGGTMFRPENPVFIIVGGK